MSADAGSGDAGAQTSILLLDACVVINLFACGHMRDILGSVAPSVEIVDRVRHESLYIRRGGTVDDADERDPIDLAEMVSLGLLAIASQANESELNTFIDLTLELGDGEAMTAAIALHRGHTVVTDDRVALRVIAGRVPTMASLELIKRWVDHEHIAPGTLKTALLNMRQRGSYLPGRFHPLRPWWDQYLATE